jgi:hypothetical protein
MNRRGDQLLLAHLASLEPTTPPARQRLEEALGEELTRRLVSALCAGAPRREEPAELHARRAVFAA